MSQLKFSYSNQPDHYGQENLNIGKDINNFMKNLPPAFTACKGNDHFFYMAQKVADWQGFDNIVVIGMGGSSLGAETLCQLNKGKPNTPNMFFADNTDSARYIIPTLNLKETAVLVISKSGGTSEVMLNAKKFIQAYEAEGLNVVNHFTGITEENSSELYDLFKSLNIQVIPHHKEIGGRYSIFSIVGLLPAALAGINIQKLLNGANASLQQFCEKPLTNNAYHGALFTGLTDKPNHVVMSYGTWLKYLSRWNAQIWAESLGKDGKGTTPIPSLGATDQHATLQLYLDGSANNIFTIIAPELNSQTEEDMQLLAAQAMGTADSLKAKGHNVRLITFDTLNEEVMGELLMQFMLETVITSFIWQVNPFNQPAVEDSKIRARAYLEQSENLTGIQAFA